MGPHRNGRHVGHPQIIDELHPDGSHIVDVCGEKIMRVANPFEERPPLTYRTSVKKWYSLDILQQFERKLAEYNASQNNFKRWLFEILSVTISALCMGKPSVD